MGHLDLKGNPIDCSHTTPELFDIYCGDLPHVNQAKRVKERHALGTCLACHEATPGEPTPITNKAKAPNCYSCHVEKAPEIDEIFYPHKPAGSAPEIDEEFCPVEFIDFTWLIQKYEATKEGILLPSIVFKEQRALIDDGEVTDAEAPERPLKSATVQGVASYSNNYGGLGGRGTSALVLGGDVGQWGTRVALYNQSGFGLDEALTPDQQMWYEENRMLTGGLYEASLRYHRPGVRAQAGLINLPSSLGLSHIAGAQVGTQKDLGQTRVSGDMYVGAAEDALAYGTNASAVTSNDGVTKVGSVAYQNETGSESAGRFALDAALLYAQLRDGPWQLWSNTHFELEADHTPLPSIDTNVSLSWKNLFALSVHDFLSPGGNFDPLIGEVLGANHTIQGNLSLHLSPRMRVGLDLGTGTFLDYNFETRARFYLGQGFGLGAFAGETSYDFNITRLKLTSFGGLVDLARGLFYTSVSAGRLVREGTFLLEREQGSLTRLEGTTAFTVKELPGKKGGVDLSFAATGRDDVETGERVFTLSVRVGPRHSRDLSWRGARINVTQDVGGAGAGRVNPAIYVPYELPKGMNHAKHLTTHNGDESKIDCIDCHSHSNMTILPAREVCDDCHAHVSVSNLDKKSSLKTGMVYDPKDISIPRSPTLRDPHRDHLIGRNVAVECNECHTAFKDQEIELAGPEHRPTEEECTGCHEANEYVSTYRGEKGNWECLDCHTERIASVVPQATTGHTAAINHGRMQGLWGNEFHQAFGGVSYELCNTCHGDSGAGTCESCHQPVEGGGLAMTAHGTVGSEVMGSRNLFFDQYHGADWLTGDRGCTQCHTSEITDPMSLCSDCHAESLVSVAGTHPDGYRTDLNETNSLNLHADVSRVTGSQICQGCHTDAQAHMKAAEQNPALSCEECHDN